MNIPTGAGDYQYPYPWWQAPYAPPAYVPYGAPGMPLQGYGTTTWTQDPVTEERIREIFREELKRALAEMKDDNEGL